MSKAISWSRASSTVLSQSCQLRAGGEVRLDHVTTRALPLLDDQRARNRGPALRRQRPARQDAQPVEQVVGHLLSAEVTEDLEVRRELVSRSEDRDSALVSRAG